MAGGRAGGAVICTCAARVPAAVRRPLWVVAMSQAVAGIVVPAIFGLFFFAAIVGALLLVIMVLVLLGDLRRT